MFSTDKDYEEFIKHLGNEDFDEALRMISSGQINPSNELGGPLQIATMANRLDVINFLLKNNFSIEAAEEETPLVTACEYGRSEIAELLIKAGAKINTFNHNMQTPLMLAAMSGLLRITQLLLEFGAKPNMRDEVRMTALDYAAEYGHEEIFNLLFPLTHPKLRFGSEEMLNQALIKKREAEKEQNKSSEINDIDRDRKIALNLLRRGEKIEDIAEMTELSFEEIETLRNTLEK